MVIFCEQTAGFLYQVFFKVCLSLFTPEKQSLDGLVNYANVQFRKYLY